MNKNSYDKKTETLFLYGDEAIKKFATTVDKLEKAVSRTLGPSGAYAVIDQGYGRIRFTKDGVTVMKSLVSNDNFESIFLEALKEVCDKTNSVVGDGTTTTTVLFASLVREGYKRLVSGVSSQKLISGLVKAADRVDKLILNFARQASDDDLKNVATISANNDQTLGELIHRAIKQINPKYGLITVEEGKSIDTELELTEGMKFDNGYISPYFVQQQNGTLELDDVIVLITNGKISSQDYILKFLEYLSMVNKAGLIICDDVDKNILGTLVLNNYQKIVSVAAVKAPGDGSDRMELLEDIAILLNGKIIDSSTGNAFKQFDENVFGKCRRVTINHKSTSLIGGAGAPEEINVRCAYLQKQIEEEESSYKIDKLKERYSKLSGKIAVIRVGAATKSEISEIKDRVLDAVSAVRSALDDGICVGGGVVFLRIKLLLEKEKFLQSIDDDAEREGAKVLIESLLSPVKQILANANCEPSVVVEKLKNMDDNFGYDAYDNVFCNFSDKGILDSIKVVRTTMKVATSVAKLFLNTHVVVAKPKASGSDAGLGGMGGMI